MTDLLYNMALLNSGFLIENPSDFTSPLYRLLKLGFGLKKDA
jgi:HSP90 family molecular chaperone